MISSPRACCLVVLLLSFSWFSVVEFLRFFLRGNCLSWPHWTQCIYVCSPVGLDWTFFSSFPISSINRKDFSICSEFFATCSLNFSTFSLTSLSFVDIVFCRRWMQLLHTCRTLFRSFINAATQSESSRVHSGVMCKTVGQYTQLNFSPVIFFVQVLQVSVTLLSILLRPPESLALVPVMFWSV